MTHDGDRVKAFGQRGVADLRAQFQAASSMGAKAARVERDLPPPPPPKHVRLAKEASDAAEERAAKAEKLSQLQHQTSLLSRAPKNDRLKIEKEPKKGGSLFVQLVFVAMLVAGGAYVLDPALFSTGWEAVKGWAETNLEL